MVDWEIYNEQFTVLCLMVWRELLLVTFILLVNSLYEWPMVVCSGLGFSTKWKLNLYELNISVEVSASCPNPDGAFAAT